MGRRGSCRGTYSRAVVQKTKEKSQAHCKQRRVIPKFDELFVATDENNKIQDASGDRTDSLDKTGRGEGIFDDSEPRLNSKRIGKPLRVNSFLTNSAQSVGHSSANDTFDKLVAGVKMPQTAQVTAHSSSSSGSSLSFTDMLFKSVLSSVPSQESSWSTGRGLKSVPEVSEDHKYTGEINDEPGANPTKQSELQSSSCRKHVRSPQLFSSIEESYTDDHSRPASGHPPGRQQTCSSGELVSQRVQAQARERTPNRVSKNSDKHSDGVTSSFTKVLKGNTEDLKTDYSKDLKLKTPKLHHMSSKVCHSLLVGRFLKSMNIESPVVQKQRSDVGIDDPSDENEFKCGLNEKRLSTKSRGSQFSGKSSVRSDTCTSTPVDTSTYCSIAKKRSQWSAKGSSFEKEDSLVPQNDSFIMLNETSVFESPVSTKLKSVRSSNEMETNPSLGSKYETCMTSDHYKQQTDLGNEESGPSRNFIKAATSYEGQTKGSVPTEEMDKEESCDKGNLNNSINVINEKFKKTLADLLDPTGNVESEASSMQNFEKDLRPGDCVHQQDIPEISPVLTNFTKRKKKNIQKPIKRLESSRNVSVVETSLLNFTNRNPKRRNRQLSIKVDDLPVSSVLENTRQSNHYSSEESGNEESVVFLRKVAFVGNTKRKLPVRFSKRLSNKTAERRTSKILLNKKHKKNESVFDNTDMSDHWESRKCTSKIVTDDEQSVVLIRREELNNGASYLGPTYSPVLTRSQTALRRIAVSLDNTHKPYDSQTSSSLTRRSSTLSLRGYLTTRDETKKDGNAEEFTNTCAKMHRISKSPNTVSYRRRMRKARQQMHVTDYDQNIYDLHIPESLIENEEQLYLVPSIGLGESKPKYELKTCEYSTNEHINISESSVVSTNTTYSNSQNYNKKSASNNDSVTTIHSEVLHSMQQWNTTRELDDECGSLPFTSVFPAKCGKGWRRTTSNMRKSPLSSIGGCATDLRRQTVHHTSVGRQTTTGLWISAIPQDINMGIQQLGESSPEKPHNQSHLQLLFCSEVNENQTLQVPTDPREHVLQLCDQETPVPLTDCFTDNRLACCKKIGEGVYGEVFMTKPNPQSLEEATVLKIMPIEGDFAVNGEPQKKFGEIISEIIISMELSNLRKPDGKSNSCETFVQVLSCWCVEGRYHPSLLHLWDVFHEEKGSENDRPHIFPDSQLYIVLEFGHGGKDLESFVFNNAKAALAVFLQIAYSLAVAERELEFEHRDLHWGNVLVAQTKETLIDFKLNDVTYTLSTCGLKATVIDFTLSRMKLPHCIMFNNLAEDPSLFIAEGDYQYEIYRQMKKATRNEWINFTPYTNILWLHYILDKMTTDCYFKNVKSKVHKTHHAQLIGIKDKLLHCVSAEDFVLRWEEGKM